MASESHDLSQAEKERKMFAMMSKFTKQQLFPTQRRVAFRQVKQGEKQAKRSWFILFLKNAHNIYEDKNNFAFSKLILTHCVVLHCSKKINGQGST